MATYYKYAEREAESYVDWGAIGKSMSDMLLEKDKLRNEKRAAIDQASRDFGEVLANAPQGEHVGARQQALEYGDNASQFMRMQDILLKSGQMDLRSYTVARQNILDDTDRAFKMNEAYQKMFKEKMDRYKNNDSSYYEVEGMERVEGFGNFSQSGLWINPTTGKVSVAMKDLQEVNGQNVYVMAENPNNMTSIDAINGLILGKWDKYKPDAVTTALADANGKQIQSMMSSGAITKIEDILQKPDYINAETNAINAALANPFDRMSLLTDTMTTAPNGKPYRFTRDEADAKQNPEAILMKIDPASGTETPQLSDEQLENSTEWMRTDARRKYDYEKTITQKQQRQAQYTPEYMLKRGDEAKQQEAEAGSWNAILMAQTAQEKKDAVDAVLASPGAQARGLIGIDLVSKPGKAVLTYADASKNVEYDIATEVEGSGNKITYEPITLENWAKKGAEVHGISDQKKSIEAGGFYGQTPSVDFTGVQANRKGPTATATGEINMPSVVKDIQSQSGFITEDNPVTTANKLTQLYGKYGFTFTPVPGTIYDEVTITPTKAGAEPITISVDEPDSEGEFKNFIQKNIDEMYMKQSGATGQGVGGKYNP